MILPNDASGVVLFNAWHIVCSHSLNDFLFIKISSFFACKLLFLLVLLFIYAYNNYFLHYFKRLSNYFKYIHFWHLHLKVPSNKHFSLHRYIWRWINISNSSYCGTNCTWYFCRFAFGSTRKTATVPVPNIWRSQSSYTCEAMTKLVYQAQSLGSSREERFDCSSCGLCTTIFMLCVISMIHYYHLG